MRVLLAATPIIFVLVGMVILKKSARVVSVAAMIYTIVLAFLFFNGETAVVGTQAYNGVISALQIMAIIFGAFTLLNVMRSSGAMDKINDTIAGITNDKRVLIILIAFCFGAFLEGAAGAGTPAAIAAPFLVGLGFNPVIAISSSLISNGIPASFGGAGVTTISGVAAISDIVPVAVAAKAAGIFHAIGGIITPTLIMIFMYGKKSLKGVQGFLIFTGIVYGITYFLVSNFIGPELVSMTTGIVSLLGGVFYLKKIKVQTPDDYIYTPTVYEAGTSGDSGSVAVSKKEYSTIQAFAPYILLLIALPTVRFNVDMKILTRFGYATWVGTVIFLVAIVGSLILKVPNKLPEVIKTALKSIVSVFIAMASLLVVANVMTATGMMSTIAKTMANTGRFYPFLAVFIGSMGAFMTGTALGSNIMFAPLHMEAASLIGLNPALLFGSNSVGASLGNIICPNNVIAVATTVGVNGTEGEIMARVLKPWFILAIIYGLLALLYTTIFPNFPTI